MPNYHDRSYWEEFARGAGWDADQVRLAGDIGSLAVARGMSAGEALDVVVARVREGRDVRIGPSPWQRLRRNQGLPALVGGVIAFLAVGVGRTGESVASTWSVMFVALVTLELFFIVGGIAKKAWKLSLIGLALTLAGLAVLVAPQRLT